MSQTIVIQDDDLLQDFLTEAGELLSDLDNKLVELEKNSGDKNLLNDIFRSFHTIKGGAGFLNLETLVNLCHRTENLFDKLRNDALHLNPELMDVILEATGAVRGMFDSLNSNQAPAPAPDSLLAALDTVLSGQPVAALAEATPAAVVPAQLGRSGATGASGPDWEALYQALLGQEALPAAPAAPAPAVALATAPAPAIAAAPARPLRTPPAAAKETTIRVDINRLDMVLNLTGEIGLTKNRLRCLRDMLVHGQSDAETLKSLDESVNHLDHMIDDLQNAVMKTRMQPIGRVFQKFPRLVRDLARQLGKEVELELVGEDTEIDKTIIEDLNDPLVHLIRNALDHGVDSPEERHASNKPAAGKIRLSAEQSGDHIIIEIADDGRGMRADVIRDIAIRKGLIEADVAQGLDERQCRNLIFLPGFSTKDAISDISGRGVGMDVVKTNIQKLNGRIDIQSVVGQGTIFTISLPLTLAILPVLVVRLGTQPFALPLSLVKEILMLQPADIQAVNGQPTLVVRGEVTPIHPLARLIGWPDSGEVPPYGVLIQHGDSTQILGVDGFVGQDQVVIKPLNDIKPKGIAGATLSGDGAIVLVLDMEQLLN